MVANKKLIGKKAEGLKLLSNLYPEYVPKFEVASFADLFINWNELNIRLNKISREYLENKLSEDIFLKKTNYVFEKLIFNKSKIKKINRSFNVSRIMKVSYRTSAELEDRESYSFAGQYKTFVDKELNSETFETCANECVKSLYSLQIVKYLKKRNIVNFEQDGSIIIQKMFYGTSSGVLFTENGANQMSVSYTSSWKNGVVEGETAQSFVIIKDHEPSLEDFSDQLPDKFIEIIKAGLSLEDKELKPLDLEWSVNEDNIALLQIRPITIQNLDYSIEWDNTNISESYPGITLPLTYSFISRLYARVYPEFLKMLGKTNKELSSNSEIFNNMLGYVNGRVYYNINNWYEMIALIPGYKYNHAFFESMLIPAKQKEIKKEKNVNLTMVNKLKFYLVGLKFVFLLLRTDSKSNKFTNDYKKKYKNYSSILWQSINAQEIINNYLKVEKDLLEMWATPILNDFRTMVFHGLLKKLFFSNKNQNLYVDFLTGLYDRSSLDPILEFNKIVKETKSILIKNKDEKNKTINKILNDESYESFRNKIKSYIQKYGGRTPDELKLENPRIGESFNEFVEFLVITATGYKGNKKNITKKQKRIEKILMKDKSLLKKVILTFLLRYIISQTKSAISTRERFRFYRAQVFGLARYAFLALGDRFRQEDIIKDKNDIFYLNFDEINSLVSGHSFYKSYKNIIKERKKIFTKYEKQYFDRRIVSDGQVATLNLRSDIKKSKHAINLKGIGVSKGIVRGKVKVVTKFDPRIEVSGNILVTPHTDPGWTMLFLNASALIVEKGNALSHASIVSREFGIPAVVAVDNACKILKNNSYVTINGRSGEIIVG